MLKRNIHNYNDSKGRHKSCQNQYAAITKGGPNMKYHKLGCHNLSINSVRENDPLYNLGKNQEFLLLNRKQIMCSQWPKKVCIPVLAHQQEIPSRLLRWITWNWCPCMSSSYQFLYPYCVPSFYLRTTQSQAAMPPSLLSFSEHSMPLRPLCVSGNCQRGCLTCLSPALCTLFFKCGKMKTFSPKFQPRSSPMLVLTRVDFVGSLFPSSWSCLLPVLVREALFW